MDMDMEPFCVKTEVLAKRTEITGREYPWGLDVNPAREVCKGDYFEVRTKQ
jgi:hypothetical protein